MRNLEKKCVELLKEIENEHALSELFLKEGFMHSEKIGELLFKLKNLLSPEEFEQWLEQNEVLEKSKAEGCMGIYSGEQVKVTLTIGVLK